MIYVSLIALTFMHDYIDVLDILLFLIVLIALMLLIVLILTLTLTFIYLRMFNSFDRKTMEGGWVEGTCVACKRQFLVILRQPYS